MSTPTSWSTTPGASWLRTWRPPIVSYSRDASTFQSASTAILPLAEVIDVAQEQARLRREIEKLQGDITKVDKKLGNDQFLAKAPPEVIEDQRERRDEALQARDRLSAALDRLAAL